MSLWRRPWFHFVGPFTLLGLFGGWLTAARFGSSQLDSGALTLLGPTPIVAGLLGALLAAKRRHWRGLAFAMPLLVPAAGAVNGVTIGLLFALTERGLGELIAAGVLVGAFCGLFFVPALLLVFLVAVRVGRARPGSLVDAAHRRAPWAIAAACIVAALFVGDHRDVDGHIGAISRFVLEAAVVSLFTVLALDLRAFAVAARRSRIAPLPVDPGAPGVHQGETLDLGMGDQVLAEPLTVQTTAYRSADAHRIRLRGSFGLARRELLVQLAGDVVMAGLALALAACLLK
jgi:hypothetical protein